MNDLDNVAVTKDETPTSDVTADVTEVLKQLPPEQVELLIRVYYDGMRVTEIARMQDIPKQTVYNRLKAAKKKLKELLKIRGIDKPIYSGEFISMISAALRNAIGTQLLSMAVAEEILHSVVGSKDKKGAFLVSRFARKQRNKAALKISAILLFACLLITAISLVSAGIIARYVYGDSVPSSEKAYSDDTSSDDSSSKDGLFAWLEEWLSPSEKDDSGSEEPSLTASNGNSVSSDGKDTSGNNTNTSGDKASSSHASSSPSTGSTGSSSGSTSSDDTSGRPENTSSSSSDSTTQSDSSKPASGSTSTSTATSSSTTTQKPTSSTSSTTSSSSSASSSSSYEFTYEIVSGEAYITGVEGTASGNLVIPATVEDVPDDEMPTPGYAVVGINSLNGCEDVTSIELPGSIRDLWGNVFRTCSKLERLYFYEANPVYIAVNNCIIHREYKSIVVGCKSSIIPDDGRALNISQCAFMGCKGLKNLVIPDSIKGFGDNGTFADCTDLEYVKIGKGVTKIYDMGSFENCTSLKTVELSEGTIYIGEWSFADCTSLTSITLPSTVTKIQSDAFSNCPNLKNVYYAGTASDRANITIGSGNTDLTSATWHYGS